MKDKLGITKGELVEQCKRIEKEQHEKEDYINKEIRLEEERIKDVQSAVKKLEHEEHDCLGDQKLLGLIDEKRILLKKIENQHGEIQNNLRKELKNSRERSERAIADIRKQINEMK